MSRPGPSSSRTARRSRPSVTRRASPEVGERVEFTSRSSDPDGALRAVRWDLDGDGRLRRRARGDRRPLVLEARRVHGRPEGDRFARRLRRDCPDRRRRQARAALHRPLPRGSDRRARPSGHADRPTLRQGGAGIEGHGALPRTKLPGQGNDAAGEGAGGALSPARAVNASRHAHRGESHATRPDRQVHPIQDACAKGAGAGRSLPPARRPAASAVHGADEPKAGSHRLCARRRGIRGRLCRRAGHERGRSRARQPPGHAARSRQRRAAAARKRELPFPASASEEQTASRSRSALAPAAA